MHNIQGFFRRVGPQWRGFIQNLSNTGILSCLSPQNRSVFPTLALLYILNEISFVCVLSPPFINCAENSDPINSGGAVQKEQTFCTRIYQVHLQTLVGLVLAPPIIVSLVLLHIGQCFWQVKVSPQNCEKSNFRNSKRSTCVFAMSGFHPRLIVQTGLSIWEEVWKHLLQNITTPTVCQEDSKVHHLRAIFLPPLV